MYNYDDDCEDDEDLEPMMPFDERDHAEKNQGHHLSKKNKLPFSFLMHHYIKATNG